MSYVIATPEMMATAAFDLARIGSQVSAASAVAAMPTTEVVAAGADEVSAGIAALAISVAVYHLAAAVSVCTNWS